MDKNNLIECFKDGINFQNDQSPLADKSQIVCAPDFQNKMTLLENTEDTINSGESDLKVLTFQSNHLDITKKCIEFWNMIDSQAKLNVINCKLVNLQQNKDCTSESDRSEVSTIPWANVLHELCRRNLHKVALSTSENSCKFCKWDLSRKIVEKYNEYKSENDLPTLNDWNLSPRSTEEKIDAFTSTSKLQLTKDAEVDTNFSNLDAVNTLQLEDRIKMYNKTYDSTIKQHENLKENNLQQTHEFEESENCSSIVDVPKFDAKDLEKEGPLNVIEILTDLFETGTSNNCNRSNAINIPKTSERLIQPEVQDLVAIIEEQRASKSEIDLKKCPCLSKLRKCQSHCNYITSEQSHDIDFKAIRRILINNPFHLNKSKPANTCINRIYKILQENERRKSNLNERPSVCEETYSQRSYQVNVSVSTETERSRLSKLNNTKTNNTNEISTKNCIKDSSCVFKNFE